MSTLVRSAKLDNVVDTTTCKVAKMEEPRILLEGYSCGSGVNSIKSYQLSKETRPLCLQLDGSTELLSLAS